jgi:hypothetical protein
MSGPEEFKNEDEFLLKLMTQAVWSALYHEQELNVPHRHLAVIKAALARGYADDLAGVTHDSEAEVEDTETPTAYVRALLGRGLSSIKHHEDELNTAHVDLAVIKAIFARLQVKIGMEKIGAEQEERLKRVTK